MLDKITILHIVECSGGVERYLELLLPRLEEKGFYQYLVCSFNYEKDKFQNMVNGVEQINLNQTFSPLQIIKGIINIRNKIKEINPDIIYCHSSFAGGIGRLASIGLPCKVVYNPHGWAFNIIYTSKKKHSLEL